MKKKKKIEREQKHFFRDYASVIKAVIVLIILVGLLVGVVLFKPVKKEDVKDPSILTPNEKNINTNDATCDGPEAPRLREEASKITISYEIVDDYLIGYMAENDEDINGNGIIDTDPVVENRDYAIKLKLSNITDDLMVRISNNIDDNTKTFTKPNVDEHGIITWYETEFEFVRTYDVEIYSARERCTNQKYREFTVSLPRYNLMSRSFDCTVEPAKNFEICQPFLWSDRSHNEDAKEFQKIMREYVQEQAREEKRQKEQKEAEENKKEESVIDKAIRILKDNYIIASAIGIAIILLIALIIKRVKKK